MVTTICVDELGSAYFLPLNCRLTRLAPQLNLFRQHLTQKLQVGLGCDGQSPSSRGEIEDNLAADLSVGLASGQLPRIEEELGNVCYAGEAFRSP
ncbi:unnamed protein product [Prunus armeniaca]